MLVVAIRFASAEKEEEQRLAEIDAEEKLFEILKTKILDNEASDITTKDPETSNSLLHIAA